jgi:hypothetical protein
MSVGSKKAQPESSLLEIILNRKENDGLCLEVYRTKKGSYKFAVKIK